MKNILLSSSEKKEITEENNAWSHHISCVSLGETMDMLVCSLKPYKQKLLHKSKEYHRIHCSFRQSAAPDTLKFTWHKKITMIKNYIPSGAKKELIGLRNRLRWKGPDRIFCISMQRTGTTSVGDFFEHFGYPTARFGTSSNNQWSKYWHDGDFEAIFNSRDFKTFQVFEDDPWWLPEFYKVLYHRFPNSKFILFTRDSESWFRSMLAHSNGQTLGNTKLHCKVYRRDIEYYQKLETDNDLKPTDGKIDNLLPLSGHEQHYKNLYEIRNKEIIDFFAERAPNRLIHCDLTDSSKWQKLGKYFKIDVPTDFKIHSNKSK